MQRAENKGKKQMGKRKKRIDQRDHFDRLPPSNKPFSCPGFQLDEIGEHVKLEAANDKMRADGPQKRDCQRFGPEMESIVCSDFGHYFDPPRDEKRPRFY